jgi:nitroreductase
MNFMDIIKNRRSVRCFKEQDTISDEEAHIILESARWAPSAKNLQPLEYILIKEESIKKELSKACRQNQPEKVPLVIGVIGNLNISKRIGKISTHDTTTDYKGTHIFIYMDAGAAIQNILLTAQDRGIDSLWISSFDEKEIYRILKLPEDYLPLAILCFGHRDKPPFSPKKRTIEERLHTNCFDEGKKQDLSYLEECKLINEPRGELGRY